MSGRVKLSTLATGRVKLAAPSVSEWHGWEWCPDQKDMAQPHYLYGKNKKTEAWLGFASEQEAAAFAKRNPLAGFSGIPKGES